MSRNFTAWLVGYEPVIITKVSYNLFKIMQANGFGFELNRVELTHAYKKRLFRCKRG